MGIGPIAPVSTLTNTPLESNHCSVMLLSILTLVIYFQNKKMRRDYEEMEQSIYSQRMNRNNHQNANAGAVMDDVNSK